MCCKGLSSLYTSLPSSWVTRVWQTPGWQLLLPSYLEATCMETKTLCNTRCNTPFLWYGIYTPPVGLEPVTCLSKARISYSFKHYLPILGIIIIIIDTLTNSLNQPSTTPSSPDLTLRRPWVLASVLGLLLKVDKTPPPPLQQVSSRDLFINSGVQLTSPHPPPKLCFE